MERQMRMMGIGVLLVAAVLAGCEEMGRTVNDALAQGDDPIETQDRLEQQLGDIPTVLDTTAAARLSGAFRAASARALPAVVQIRTVALTEVPTGFMPGVGRTTRRRKWSAIHCTRNSVRLSARSARNRNGVSSSCSER